MGCPAIPSVSPSVSRDQSLSYNGTDFTSLIDWIKSIPDSHQNSPQKGNYLSVTIVIRREIEPKIQTPSNLGVEGASLSSKNISQLSQQPNDDYERIKEDLLSRIDPKTRLFLEANGVPLKKSPGLTEITRTTPLTTRSISYICKPGSDPSELTNFCANIIKEVNKIRETEEGLSFKISATALSSDSLPVPNFPGLESSPFLAAVLRNSKGNI